MKISKKIILISLLVGGGLVALGYLALKMGFDMKAEKERTMTMTTSNDEVRFVLNGSGTATVDWGNGSEKKTLEISEYTDFSREFSNTNSRTVTISGMNISYFGCIWGGLTELDVSGNTTLKELSLKVNQLTRLDLLKNTALTYVDIKANQLTAAALNDLFRTLHSKGGIINIAYNPGTDDCNKSIAEAKGWTVEIVEQEEDNYE
jgi:Leucine-rich repeat (LRR) protein